MSAETKLPIRSDADVVAARQTGRRLGAELGFEGTDLVVIATAISELARNMLSYAGGGEILLARHERGGRVGLKMVARDQGPGIEDLELAMQDGYSTSGSLGLGLPGTRRLMDEFSIESAVGVGTAVTAVKWLPPRVCAGSGG